MEKKLYEWQEECLRRWLANNGRGMVQAVTGSGKTYLALTAAKRLEEQQKKELRVKIVVPTSSLMLQWDQAIKNFLSSSQNREAQSKSMDLPGGIGLRGGGHKSESGHKYMIYVINSARYELARQILTELRQGLSVLFIADECHHYTSGQNQLIFEFLPHIKPYENHFYSLGLTATLPSGPELTFLTSVLGRNIYRYDMAQAQACHTVCPCDVYHIGLSLCPEERNSYQELSDRMAVLYSRLLSICPSLNVIGQGERYELLRILSGDKNQRVAEAAAQYMALTYKRKSLVCLASGRSACALDLVRRLNEKEKIMIFSERIQQAEELFLLLQKYYPEKVGRYHSKMGNQANKNTIERFRTGSLRILIACKAVDEGIDVPDASVGIIMSGTSTPRQRIQRLGRIIRKSSPEKRSSLYYLHIEETSEDSCFLPDEKNHRLFELFYNYETKEFIHPAYDSCADLLLQQLEQKGADEKKLKEVTRCLELGRIRSDWMMEQQKIQEHLEKARYTSEKNYWICMKKMSQYSTEGSLL